jgi:hypothetical protein
MKRFLLHGTLVLAAGLASTAAAQEPVPEAVQGDLVTLTGCVADASSDDFVLTHVQRVSAPGPQVMVLGARGMELAPGEPVYWLSKDSVKKLRGHRGHKVEVTGVITDVSTGRLQIKNEPGRRGPDTKLEIDARGKDASAKTDEPVDAAPGKKTEKKVSVPVHRIAVDSVKMVSATCP